MQRIRHGLEVIVPNFKTLVYTRREARELWSEYLDTLSTSDRSDAVDMYRHLHSELQYPTGSDKLREEVTMYYNEYKDFLS